MLLIATIGDVMLPSHTNTHQSDKFDPTGTCSISWHISSHHINLSLSLYMRLSVAIMVVHCHSELVSAVASCEYIMARIKFQMLADDAHA